MQQALPEDLWFFIIIMALLILAYLWRDTGSSGTSGKNRRKKKTTPDEPEIPDQPPDIVIGRRGSTSPGEECWMKASFSSGTGNIQELKAQINGEEVGIRDRNGNEFISNPAEVQEGKNKLKAIIKTEVATKTDSLTFPAGEEVPDDQEGPELELDYEIIDEAEGHVNVEAQGYPRSSEIVFTKITLFDGDRVIGDNQEEKEYCIIEPRGLPPREYVAAAVTQDENDLTKEDTVTISLGDTEGPGTVPEEPGEPRGPGRGRNGPSGMPNIFNPQIESSPEINLDVPEEAIQILRDIVGGTEGRVSDDVSQELGVEANQILEAMSMLQKDLDGEDNQQILRELERIRETMGAEEMSVDALENALRSVLHDVFGRDLQDIMEGLEVNGFDEEAIVRAINEKNIDVEPLERRLSDIEETVTKLETGGGEDFSEIKQKLDDLESAIRDTEIDEALMEEFMSKLSDMELKRNKVNDNVDEGMNEADIMRLMDEIQGSGNPELEMESILEVIREQGKLNRELVREIVDKEERDHKNGVVNPMAMTRDLEESVSEGNKNPENDINGMPDNIEGLEHELDTDIKRQIEHLEGEYNNLRELVQDQGEIENLESHMEHEIEEVTEHLKKARQIEHHLDRLFNERKNMSDSDFAEKLNDDIHSLNGHISKANNVISNFRDDFGVFREDVSDLDNVVNSMDKVEGQIEQQEEELEEVEKHMENAISQLQSNPDVDMSEYTR